MLYGGTYLQGKENVYLEKWENQIKKENVFDVLANVYKHISV